MTEKFTFYADLLLYNGRIHTFVSETSIADAMLIYDDKIIAVGSYEEFNGVPVKSVIDLKGKTVIPGLIDTHMHLYHDYKTQKKVPLEDANSFDDICRRMKDKLTQRGGNDWLLGKGLHMDRLAEGCFPTREVLDQISSTVPVAISSFCAHANILNSKAMELCGFTDDYISPLPNTVDYDKCGIPNGIIREELFFNQVESIIPAPDLATAAAEVSEYIQIRAAQGLTTIHTNAIDDTYNLELLQEIERQGKLSCRIVFYPTNLTRLSAGAVSGFGSNTIKIGAMKMFIDGSVGAATCAMKEPYADTDSCGATILTQDEINKKMKDAYDNGMEIAVHAIGDRAIDMALTGFEYAYDEKIGWNRRFYLVHGYLPDFADLERMKKLPLVIPTQPVFIRNFVGWAKTRLGADRAEKLFPNRTFMDHGILIGGSSDAPVQEPNPFYGIQCAVTRKALLGSDEVIGAKEAITVYEAIDMYTRQASYVAQEEAIKGTLEPGKLADFLVLSEDIFTMDPARICEMKVNKTFVGGKEVSSFDS